MIEQDLRQPLLSRGPGGCTHFLRETQEVRVLCSESAFGRRFCAGTRGAMSQGRVDVMAINGLITTKEVLRYGATIVREFGTAAYVRCCFAIVLRKRTTFLNCVFTC